MRYMARLKRLLGLPALALRADLRSLEIVPDDFLELLRSHLS